MSSSGIVRAYWRTLAIAFAALSGLLLVVLVLRSGPTDVDDVELPDTVREPALRLAPSGWADLDGFEVDALDGFAEAFGRSCGVFARRDAQRQVGDTGGVAGDWREVCARVASVDGVDELRGALLEELRPWSVLDNDDPEGLFTGYYEPSLRGSRVRGNGFETPLYRRPPELVAVDLGAFREDLAGRRVAGTLEGTRLVPFADRADLERGTLARRDLELVWVDDPIAAFFLHIQGSGRVDLVDGGHMRVGYDGQNGHPYTAIGRELVARSELVLEEVSMQSIRDWLVANPAGATEIMNTNRSFVFFRELGDEGPRGSQGVALTPGRTLAVDRRFLPMGVPLWLDTTAPSPDPTVAEQPLRRLMVSQDTGGAIRGPVRGDVFWGHGGDAEEIAGRMKSRGRLWLLLPAGLDPRGPDQSSELAEPSV